MKGTALIVDDNVENLYMLRLLLQGHGYRVMEAHNGEEALAIARECPPDVVISDILMPVMDGFTLCREWKKDESLRFRPFVFYTATYTDPKDEEFALSLGAERFIVKPADPEDFMHIIEGVLQDFEAGKVVPPETLPRDEASILERYNQRLIQKLEKKMLDLERETALRRRSEKRLRLLVNLFLGLGTDCLKNMERIVRLGREVLEIPLIAYLRKGKESVSLIVTGEEECRKIREEEAGFLLRLMEEKDFPLVVEALQARREVKDNGLLSVWGMDSLLGWGVRLHGMSVGLLACLREGSGGWTAEEISIAGMLARALSIEEERLDAEEKTRDFIDVASHEIRHPVTIVRGYAQSLEELWDRLSHEDVRDMLQAIEYGSDRLERLASRLLDVSRIQRGRMETEVEETDLGLALSRWKNYIRRSPVGNRIRVEISKDLGTGRADLFRLEELLDILVENAVKFSPPDTEIEVEIARDGDKLTGAVMDRGYGVPAEIAERIFERFFQGEDVLHHSTEGMGIGLYIAREIVKEHGGRIWYQPREGGGSAFRFFITV